MTESKLDVSVKGEVTVTVCGSGPIQTKKLFASGYIERAQERCRWRFYH
jgi:hypothetical protein